MKSFLQDVGNKLKVINIPRTEDKAYDAANEILAKCEIDVDGFKVAVTKLKQKLDKMFSASLTLFTDIGDFVSGNDQGFQSRVEASITISTILQEAGNNFFSTTLNESVLEPLNRYQQAVKEVQFTKERREEVLYEYDKAKFNYDKDKEKSPIKADQQKQRMTQFWPQYEELNTQFIKETQELLENKNRNVSPVMKAIPLVFATYLGTIAVEMQKMQSSLGAGGSIKAEVQNMINNAANTAQSTMNSVTSSAYSTTQAWSDSASSTVNSWNTPKPAANNQWGSTNPTFSAQPGNDPSQPVYSASAQAYARKSKIVPQAMEVAPPPTQGIITEMRLGGNFGAGVDIFSDAWNESYDPVNTGEVRDPTRDYVKRNNMDNSNPFDNPF